MLIKFMGDIEIDKSLEARNLRINFMPRHQVRFKIDLINSDGSIHPVDLFISNYTNLQFKIPAISVTINGQDVINDRNFSITLSYNYIQRQTHVTGYAGNIMISKIISQSNIADAIDIIRIIASI